MNYVKVARVKEFMKGHGKTIAVSGRQIAVFRIGEAFYALDNQCSHMGGPLGEGKIENSCVICPWHAARFDIKSGKVQSPPAGSDVSTFPVKIENGDVLIGVVK